MTSPAINDSPALMRDLRWSPAEKAIARKVFESALLQELEAVVRETKDMATKIQQVGDAWDLEYYLAKRRVPHFSRSLREVGIFADTLPTLSQRSVEFSPPTKSNR